MFIDIGTRNIQLIRLDKGVPKYESSKATTKGMSSIYRGIADITKTLDVGINDGSSVQIYLERTATGKMKLKKVVEDKILDYLIENVFAEINQCLNEMQVSPILTKYVFLGGGSDILRRFLDASFTTKDEEEDEINAPIYVENPYFATSLGLFKKGERIYKYDKHTAAKTKKAAKKAKVKKAEKQNS